MEKEIICSKQKMNGKEWSNLFGFLSIFFRLIANKTLPIVFCEHFCKKRCLSDFYPANRDKVRQINHPKMETMGCWKKKENSVYETFIVSFNCFAKASISFLIFSVVMRA